MIRSTKLCIYFRPWISIHQTGACLSRGYAAIPQWCKYDFVLDIKCLTSGIVPAQSNSPDTPLDDNRRYSVTVPNPLKVKHVHSSSKTKKNQTRLAVLRVGLRTPFFVALATCSCRQAWTSSVSPRSMVSLKK